MDNTTMNAVAKLVAELIFLFIKGLVSLIMHMCVAVLVIWVSKGIWGMDLSHSFAHILVGLYLIRFMQEPLFSGGKRESKRKN